MPLSAAINLCDSLTQIITSEERWANVISFLMSLSSNPNIPFQSLIFSVIDNLLSLDFAMSNPSALCFVQDSLLSESNSKTQLTPEFLTLFLTMLTIHQKYESRKKARLQSTGKLFFESTCFFHPSTFSTYLSLFVFWLSPDAIQKIEQNLQKQLVQDQILAVRSFTLEILKSTLLAVLNHEDPGILEVFKQHQSTLLGALSDLTMPVFDSLHRFFDARSFQLVNTEPSTPISFLDQIIHKINPSHPPSRNLPPSVKSSPLPPFRNPFDASSKQSYNQPLNGPTPISPNSRKKNTQLPTQLQSPRVLQITIPTFSSTLSKSRTSPDETPPSSSPITPTQLVQGYAILTPTETVRHVQQNHFSDLIASNDKFSASKDDDVMSSTTVDIPTTPQSFSTSSLTSNTRSEKRPRLKHTKSSSLRVLAPLGSHIAPISTISLKTNFQRPQSQSDQSSGSRSALLTDSSDRNQKSPASHMNEPHKTRLLRAGPTLSEFESTEYTHSESEVIGDGSFLELPKHRKSKDNLSALELSESTTCAATLIMPRPTHHSRTKSVPTNPLSIPHHRHTLTMSAYDTYQFLEHFTLQTPESSTPGQSSTQSRTPQSHDIRNMQTIPEVPLETQQILLAHPPTSARSENTSSMFVAEAHALSQLPHTTSVPSLHHVPKVQELLLSPPHLSMGVHPQELRAPDASTHLFPFADE
ncbi:hypothetical protein BLNAU_2249 [Blattamonas nauphoetae]|uniref:Uncharacterized protein n=1 Tax=Blattamonas nauphoetae TaxID=2049346 RepID=A0ABQ9YGD4_9EUKA|nr:hypothetical protein BLNAU_2249 [Blattamonas nauphoetae]